MYALHTVPPGTMRDALYSSINRCYSHNPRVSMLGLAHELKVMNAVLHAEVPGLHEHPGRVCKLLACITYAHRSFIPTRRGVVE